MKIIFLKDFGTGTFKILRGKRDREDIVEGCKILKK